MKDPMISAPPGRQGLRYLQLAIAPAVGLLLYWRVLTMWFQDDDFTWITLNRDLHEHGMLHALFHPFAQGTVRVLDRIHFLALSEAFGYSMPAYRVVGLITFIAALTLVLLIGERLTGSRAAGIWAATFWAASANSVPSIVWASGYYQLLCAVCLLGALYSRLRGWRAAEWACYLAAFGAMEIAPMYAGVALICALALDSKGDRKGLRSALWLFLPAAVYTVAHFLFVPKLTSGPYSLSLDSRLPATIASYLKWTFEPGAAALRSRAEQLQAPELLAGLIFGLTLGWFTVRCLMRREWTAALFAGWFIVLMAPMLLLPDHLTPYYLTVPSIGIAWLAGWGISRAWAEGGRVRLAVLALAAIFLAISGAGIESQTRWFQMRANRMRQMVDGVAAEAAAYPGSAIVLRGVDAELLNAGYDGHPFLLVGVERVWRVPDDISEVNLRAAVAKGETRVLDVHPGGVTDVTGDFTR